MGLLRNQLGIPLFTCTNEKVIPFVDNTIFGLFKSPFVFEKNKGIVTKLQIRYLFETPSDNVKIRVFTDNGEWLLESTTLPNDEIEKTFVLKTPSEDCNIEIHFSTDTTIYINKLIVS